MVTAWIRCLIATNPTNREILGAAAAFLMFCAVIAKYVITTITSGRGFGEDCATQECPSRVISALLETFISAIAVVVVAVPEGLPLAVTLALAYGTTRMLKDHNLVRVLSACETMGGVTAVLTDKTGTLTENKMTVVRGMLGCDMPFRKQDEKDEAEVEAPEQEHKTRKSIEDLAQALAQGGDNGPPKPCLDPPTSLQTLLALFQESVAINSSAFSRSDPNNPGQHQLVGSRTESALLQLVEALGGPSGDWEGLRRMDSMEVLHTYPFSSAQKAMATIVRIKTNEEPRYRVHVKGAGEILLEKCDQAPCLEAGQVVQLHPEIKERLGREIEGMAESTLRTLCIAYRDLSEQEFRDISADKGADGQSEPSLETLLNTDGLVLLAIVGIEDPIREGVARAIAKCQKAGVRIIMCTGDNEKTARSIADRCGILGEDGMSMQGVDFRKRLENGDLDQGSLAKLQVLSRSSPTDKQGLVRRLQELGETVAVTGDGTNDAPALKLADIGLSMGKSGTEVAKEASEIVLMEDRFEDCVKAIMWGRAIGDAVRKFLQFQLTVNLTATVLAFTSSLADGNQQSVLTAVQMLWINFAMDSLAGLALATEEPTEDILDRPPQGKDSALISPGMWKMIAGESVLQIAVTLTLLFAGPTMFGLENLAYAGGITRDLDTVEAPPDFAGSPADFSALCWNEKTKLRSIVFNTFVFLQLFNELNCRRLGRKLNVFANLTRSMSFVWVMALVVPIQICIMFFGGTVFRIAPLLPTEWAVSVGLGLLALPVGLMVRLLPLDGMFEGKIVLAREEHEPIHEPEEPEAPSVRVTIGPWPGQFPPTPNSEGASVSRSGTPMSAASSMATSASSASRLKWYKILRGGRLHAADLVSIASSGGPRRRTRRDLFYRTPARARWEMLQDAVVRRKWSVSDATSGERERLIPIDGANQGTSTTSEPSTSAN